ncbi:hypothetical protein BVC71_10000 [Marivivens niveibacter]|uniref:NAD(P)-binding domain-containing protein n=1 Tax=Marivivens niveibacter TaxID=1930667 RepID=A0A251WXG5_9RHOB|nr:SDR family oxidoreductase [Marivivens niveibacter]OUD09036.1 hypothetical protein BVC71_10000 [Marivivens niveibacter]
MTNSKISTAVLYGATSDVAPKIATALHQFGIKFAAVDPDGEAAKSVVTGTDGISMAGDLADNGSAAGLAYDLADQLGDIDIIICLSDGPMRQGFAVPVAHFDALTQSQLRPVYMIGRHFVPGMAAANGGKIAVLTNSPAQGDVWANASAAFVRNALDAMANDPLADDITFEYVQIDADTDLDATLSSLSGSAQG